MPKVFFSYYLRDADQADEFATRMLEVVEPAASAEEAVLGWTLHRSLDWPGGSDDRADFVSVADVTDLRRWRTVRPTAS